MKIHRSRHLPSRVPRWRVLKLRSSSLIPFHFAISLGFSYSYSALAVLVLVLEDTATSTSTSTISLSTSTVRNQECATSKLTRRVMKIQAKHGCEQFWPPHAQLQNASAALAEPDRSGGTRPSGRRINRRSAFRWPAIVFGAAYTTESALPLDALLGQSHRTHRRLGPSVC
jgi:hypothetical protein